MIEINMNFIESSVPHHPSIMQWVQVSTGTYTNKK